MKLYRSVKVTETNFKRHGTVINEFIRFSEFLTLGTGVKVLWIFFITY